MSRTEGKFRSTSFSVMCFVFSKLMMRPVLSSIVIRATTFSHNGPRMAWCDRFSLSCRSESWFEYTQADSTISANRPRLWKCVRVRVVTSRHEDEIRMTQMKAFLSPVPLNVGPSAESRGLDSPLVGWTLMNPETVFVAPPSRMAKPSRLLIENATKSSMLSSS